MDLILLQASSPNAGFINMAMLALMFIIFWFFLIRPQAKRQKEQRNFVDSLKKDMEVVTTSGILGRISKIEDNIITLEVSSKVYLRVTKGSISKEWTDSMYGTAAK